MGIIEIKLPMSDAKCICSYMHFFYGWVSGWGSGEWGGGVYVVIPCTPAPQKRNISSDTMLEMQVLKIKVRLKLLFKLFRTKKFKIFDCGKDIYTHMNF